MKKQILILFSLSIFLTSFALFPFYQREIQNIENDNIENDSSIEEKITATTVLNTLGWELDEVRNIYVPDSDATSYADFRCKAMTENVIVLVQEEFQNQKSYDYCQGFAERFQRDAYEPVAEYIGVPRTSPVDNSSNVAIIFADIIDGGSRGYFTAGSLFANGFESVQIDLAEAYAVLVHEYQHCVHANYRTFSEERWFNEGMSELLPVLLGFTTSNSSVFLPYFTGEESGGSTTPNIPLLYWDFWNENNFVSENYGGAFAFVFYIYEHYGASFLGDIVKNTDYNVTESFNQVLTNNGYDKDFKDLLADWALAVRIDDPQLNPLWHYKWMNVNVVYANQMAPFSDSDLPLEFNGKVFEAAGSTYKMNIRGDTINALKYDFDGRAPGEYRVYLIANEFVNMTFTKKYMSELIIDSETQNGSGFIMLPNNVMNVDMLVVNTYYKDTGVSSMYIPHGTDMDTLREEFYCDVTAFDPGLIGTIESLTYDNRTFHIEAELDWDLEESLEDYGMSPHVVLYDADGEFAFNLQSYLTYDEASDKWVGDLVITEDIKAGIYQIKLFMQGTELDSEEGKVSGSSVPGFLILPSFLAVLVITMKRRNKN